jgi:hypothetical protein
MLPALRFSKSGVTYEDSTVRITDDEVVRKKSLRSDVTQSQLAY